MQNTLCKKIITIEEVERILKAIDQPYERLATALVAYAGLRIQEVGNLKMSDIDMGNNRILIRTRKVENYRYVPITEILRKYFKGVSKGFNEDERLFPVPSGIRCYGTHMSQFLLRIKNDCEFGGKINWRTLRYSDAMNLLENNTSIHEISYLLGHRSIPMTIDYFKVWSCEINSGIYEK